MSNSANSADDRSIRSPATRPDSNPDQLPTLEAVVVTREGAPDRCTIGPVECTETQRANRWLSADLDIFIDLEAVR